MTIDRRLRERVPLAPLTTFEVGGPARFLLDAESDDDVAEALAFARARGLPLFVLAGGSNVVVADGGFDGLVLRVAMRGVEAIGSSDGDVVVRAFAGEPLDALVARTVADGSAGLECLSGVPGSVGATPIQNVGAYGQEVSETIVAVDMLDRASGERTTFGAKACGFGYRSSVFKGALRERHVVLSVTFALRPGGAPSVKYAELERYLAANGVRSPSLADVRAAVLALRRAKSMVIDPHDENRRSAGSFFVNPVVSPDEADEVARRAGPDGRTMPRFSAAGGISGGDRVKLSAAWLIERAGFPKGTADGPVGLSTRHALALVNRGGAGASDLVAFAARIRRAVRERFGVALAHEPELVGFSRSDVAALEGAG